MILRLPTTGTILAIESSCDETSAAILENGTLRSVVVSSQFFHERFGGVVPELASRAHVRSIQPIITEAFSRAERSVQDVTAVAATFAPGLMGSLLVGLNVAKGIALGRNVPLIGVHHIEAHIFSSLLEEERPELPFIAAIVSGGHTMLVLVRDVGSYELLGETLDDAAGEAFDKVGKMLGLPYPAGPEIDRLAETGDPGFVRFPRAMIQEEHHDFSFSGIKTSVLYYLKKQAEITDDLRRNVAASFQRAMVETIVTKTLRAAAMHGVRDIVAVGGVSANRELRATFARECAKSDRRFFTPRPLFSTDNAAMIAMLGALKLERGQIDGPGLTARPRLAIAPRL